MRPVLLALAALLAPTPALAEWREARTPHFVIWADLSESSIRREAERLEGVDQLLRKATNIPADKAVVPVRVYLVGDEGVVQRGLGSRSPEVAGFYTVNAAGPMAVSPVGKGSNDYASVILNHEYAHHFQLQYLPATYPSWYVEGFAELVSTAAPVGGGRYSFGRAASHREYSLTSSRWLPVATLLSGDYGTTASDSDFYGQSWLLAHYLTFDAARAARLKAYLNALSAGQPHEESVKALDSLDALNRELRKYLAAASFSYKAVDIAPVPADDIVVRALTPGEAALVKPTIAMRDNLSKERAAELLPVMRAAAARYPGETYPALLLADAAFAADDHEAALAAADRALKLDPNNSRALTRKGMAMLELAQKAPASERAARIRAADRLFVQASKRDPEAPLPLVGSYRAYAALGKVDDHAVRALEQAVSTVPQDGGFRMLLVREYAERRRYREALATLVPLANSPHPIPRISTGALRRDQGQGRRVLIGAGTRRFLDAPSVCPRSATRRVRRLAHPSALSPSGKGGVA